MSTVQVDAINESTTGSGVTIDGVLLKDSKIGGTITVPGSTGTMALTSDISAGGLESAQQWVLTANITTTGVNTITTNLANQTEQFLGNMGNLVSESSGQFSFSETGYYLLTVVHASNFSTNNAYAQIYVAATSDNFATESRVGYQQSRGMANTLQTSSNTYILDVTDTVNQKIRFKTDITSGGTVAGSSGDNITTFTFMKLGDT